ncbi:MAG: hypothetical protein ACOYMG_26510 [Candidatus Methylumidiphilus sp.]
MKLQPSRWISLILSLSILGTIPTAQAAAPAPEPGMTFAPGQGVD